MLAVVMLHAITLYVFNPSYYGTTSYYANLLLNSFSRIGVPLFLMISGALILSDPLTLDIKAFYKKRLARILIPLLSWNVLYYAFFLIFDKAPFDFLTLVNGVLNNGTAYHLWYLYALFGLYLLSPFLKRIADNVTLGQMTFFMLLVGFCTTFRPFINNTVSPLYMYLFDPLVNGYALFFVAGFILNKMEVSKKANFLLYLLGVSGLLLSFFGNHMASSESIINFRHNGGFDISAFLLAIGVFSFFKNHINLGSRFIKSVSGLTFGIYLVHVAVMEILLKYFTFEASPIVLELYLFLTTLVVSLAFAKCIGRIKFLN